MLSRSHKDITQSIKTALADKGCVHLMLLPPSKDFSLATLAEKNILPLCHLHQARHTYIPIQC